VLTCEEGSLQVHVLGNSLVPRSLRGRFTAVCAILRQLHLTISLAFSMFLYHVRQWLPFLPLPPTTRSVSSQDWSILRSTEPFDVFLVDQLSASVPLLRWWLQTRVVFYCHFPDLLLSPGRLGHGTAGEQGNALRELYRLPIDRLEEFTTGEGNLSI
jgi:alpha-1,3/alpha-1,6-mannosyltransferase